jgi:hypothetical protein
LKATLLRHQRSDGLQIHYVPFQLKLAHRSLTVWLCHRVAGRVTTVTCNISCPTFSTEHTMRSSGATESHDCVGKYISANIAGRLLEFCPHSFSDTHSRPLFFPLQIQPVPLSCRHQL